MAELNPPPVRVSPLIKVFILQDNAQIRNFDKQTSPKAGKMEFSHLGNRARSEKSILIQTTRSGLSRKGTTAEVGAGRRAALRERNPIERLNKQFFLQTLF